jgi:hypothetical protein
LLHSLEQYSLAYLPQREKHAPRTQGCWISTPHPNTRKKAKQKQTSDVLNLSGLQLLRAWNGNKSTFLCWLSDSLMFPPGLCRDAS